MKDIDIFLILKVSLSVAHTFIHYPEESQISLGAKRKGCFEPPSDEPPRIVNIPDILPLHKQENPTVPSRMQDPDPTTHPDSDTKERYVMGTRLQGNLQKSHKLNSCQFHNLDLATGIEDVKTMLQESMQVVRKHRTIQADKLRSIECSFLANFIADFKHNEKKILKQRKTILTSFKSIQRDPDTWRMVGI